MPTLYNFEVRVILRHLDRATDSLPPDSTAARNIRMARERLLDVAITEVAVEPLAEAA